MSLSFFFVLFVPFVVHKLPSMRASGFPPATIALLLGGALLLIGLLLFLTWRGVHEENLETATPVSAPVSRATPAPRSEPAVSIPIQDPSSEGRLTAPITDSTPLPEESPEPVPFNPTTSVPAVFGATGNGILRNIPYAPGLEDIANDFIERVKQGGWDTTSEAYKKNWEQAAEEADNLVRARYGTEVYLRLKQEAAP